MLARIITRSLVRRGRRKALSLAAVALGITAATVVATLALDVGDKVSRELRSFGANITVVPATDGPPVTIGGVDYRPAAAGAFLQESDLPSLKRIYWANNIVAFAPFLYAPASLAGRRVVLIGSWFSYAVPVGKSESFRTGLRDLHIGWRVQGQWPDDTDSHACLVGASLARAEGLEPGSTVNLSNPGAGADGQRNYSCRVSGVAETGGAEDEQVMAPLAGVQAFARQAGRVRRIEVSALTKPEDDFARRDPKSMTPEEFERWSCSPYVSSINYQIERAIPGSVSRPVLSVTETEGRVLGRIGSLMLALAVAALVTACLAVASMMLASVIERRAEIGLYQSLGATRARVAGIFLLEGSALGLAGGVAGYLAGTVLAHYLGRTVFGSPAVPHLALLPAVLLVALLVTWGGSAVPLARGLRTPAAMALRD